MKKNDWTIIIFVAVFSSIVAFFAAGALINPESEPLEVEVVEPITAEFGTLDSDYFNDNSINPTQLIRIGDDEGNVSPFRPSN